MSEYQKQYKYENLQLDKNMEDQWYSIFYKFMFLKLINNKL